jgi:hypothetical protein
MRLSRALAVEMHENRIEAARYLNIELLREQQTERPGTLCQTAELLRACRLRSSKQNS